MAFKQRLNWLWRLCATVIAYTVFGIGALIMGSVFFGLVKLFTSDPLLQKKRFQYIIHKGFSSFISMMNFLGIISINYEGLEQLKKDRGVIVIANHPSLIDVVIIIGLIPEADCIVKQALWSNFFVKWIVRNAYIPNIKSEELVDKCQAALNSGGNLVIFPEGTRSEAGQPYKFQRGAANLAILTDADIRLIQIHCYPEFLTKRLKWYQIPEKKAHFSIKVDDRIKIDSLLADVKKTMASRKLTQYLEKYFNENIKYE